MLNGRTDFAFSLLRDVYGLSEENSSGLDPASLVEKVQRIHKGLSVEHEFAAIASWLGKCTLLNQLDDVLHSSGEYRVPDFLVVCQQEGKRVPFLVEVKSDIAEKLVWTESYLQSLQAFAKLMGLPLLVAWKHHRLWVLADTALFSKKVTAYHLTFDTAVKNNLMSKLFGNVWIRFAEEFRFELTMRIEEDIDFNVEVLPEGQYRMRIEDAAIWGGKGRFSREQEKGLWPFLVTTISDTQFRREFDVATHTFLTEQSMFNLSDVLLAQLSWHQDGDSID